MFEDMSLLRIDVNGDVGESFGSWQLGDDAALMTHLSSANIACGFHAGDPGVMRETVGLALAHGVAPGAHPGFQDLAGFGRREMRLSAVEIEDLVAYQVGALAGIAAAQGARLQHVKPHGALYNMAAADPGLATAIARAVKAVDPRLRLVGLAGSALIAAGASVGLVTVAEVFADRAYQADGRLVPRSRPGSVIDDPSAVAGRAVEMVRNGSVTAADGTKIRVRAETLCVHGDTRSAVVLARAVREALAAAGIEVMPPPARPVQDA